MQAQTPPTAVVAGGGPAIRTLRIVAVLIFALSPFAAEAQMQKGEFYVLDGFGGVHAGGNAPVISPATPYFGFDVAEDLIYVPQGNSAGNGEGLLVLDAFGGVHVGGALTVDPPALTTPYFGFDVARAIAARVIPPRANGDSSNNIQTVSSSTFIPYASAVMYAPDDGFLIVNGSVILEMCASSSGQGRLYAGLSLDGNAPLEEYTGTIPDCSTSDTDAVAMTRMFQVAAGKHRVDLVLAKSSGLSDPIIGARGLTVIFIDHSSTGVS